MPPRKKVIKEEVKEGVVEKLEGASKPTPSPISSPQPLSQPASSQSASSTWQQSLERFADKIVNAIPYGRLKIWKNMLFHPHETMGEEIKNASIGQGAKDFFVSSIPLAVLMTVFNGVFALTNPIFSSLYSIFVVFSILSPILGILMLFVYNAVVYGTSKILGGKGTFTQQLYLNCQAYSGINLVNFLVYIPSLIPCVGSLFALLFLPFGIYSIFLLIKSIRFTHGFSRVKTIVIWLAGMFVIVILMIIIFGIAVAILEAVAIAGILRPFTASSSFGNR